MPFGAELTDKGMVRFGLWAPDASSIDLCLEGPGAPATLTMERAGHGWFTLETDRAAIGSRYRYDVGNGLRVPDPASRFQPGNVHGASEVVDPAGYTWRDTAWRGRPWHEAVVYELHVGAFSPTGDFAGVERELDRLAELGVTAVELMPVAAFPGRRNWGYDGVLPFAPDSTYGRPEDLKQLVQTAHVRGLMVLLDVVYNHFGPEGNYLHGYASRFFTARHPTPWGDGINFDEEQSETVRRFFIHNALYWLEEYHLDGLRLDAVHAVADDSSPDILTELAEAVRTGPGRDRHVHLVLENDHNEARYLERDERRRTRWYDAQWNDDAHHALHCLLTGETDGYYADYADRPAWYAGRCLAEGFAYQGEHSGYRNGARRGEPSRHLPSIAFVNFLQNHDQIGNRAHGERIDALAAPAAVEAALAVLLLAPSPPLLFMGQEFASARPFLFFCDFGSDLAKAVTDGRRREFARFARFADPESRAAIPDPNDPATFERCRLDSRRLDAGGKARLNLHRQLLALRAEHVVPRLSEPGTPTTDFETFAATGTAAWWRWGDGSELSLLANLGPEPIAAPRHLEMTGRRLWATRNASAPGAGGLVSPWTVYWTLDAAQPDPS